MRIHFQTWLGLCWFLSSSTAVLIILQQLHSMLCVSDCSCAQLHLELVEDGVAGNQCVVICIITWLLKVCLITCYVAAALYFFWPYNVPDLEKCCAFGSALLR